MDAQSTVKAFYKMSIQDSFIQLNDAEKWVQAFTKQQANNKDTTAIKYEVQSGIEGSADLGAIYIPETLHIESKTTLLDNLEIQQKMLAFAEQIEKNLSTLQQMEILIRDISSKDTQNGVNFMIQSLRYYSAIKNDLSNVKLDAIVGLFPDTASLIHLGYFMSVALAANRNIVMYAQPKIYIIISWFVQQAIFAGIPKQFVVVPGNLVSGCGSFYQRNNLIYNFANTYLKDFEDVYYNPCQTTILSMPCSTGKSPMIVFSDADVPSACVTAINAAYSHHGSLPWSLDTIFVQEEIIESFVDTLCKHMASVKFGAANDVNVDYVNVNVDVAERANELQIRGFKTLTFHDQAILVVGARANESNVLSGDSDCDESVIVSIVAFRHCNEAINLANNHRWGFAASVWCENTETIDECTKKLNVGLVWVNTHGNFSPEYAFTPYKKSGFGCFGGNDGFRQLRMMFDSNKPPLWNRKIVKWDKQLNAAKKAQVSWSNLCTAAKITQLQSAAMHIKRNHDKFKNQQEVDTLIAKLTNCARFVSHGNSVRYDQHYTINTFHEPIGVIAYKINDSLPNYDLIITALLAGNALIINTTSNHKTVINELCNILPSHLLQVIGVEVMFYNHTATLDTRLDALLLAHDMTLLFCLRDGVMVIPVNPALETGLDCFVTRRKCVWRAVKLTF